MTKEQVNQKYTPEQQLLIARFFFSERECSELLWQKDIMTSCMLTDDYISATTWRSGQYCQDLITPTHVNKPFEHLELAHALLDKLEALAHAPVLPDEIDIKIAALEARIEDLKAKRAAL